MYIILRWEVFEKFALGATPCYHFKQFSSLLFSVQRVASSPPDRTRSDAHTGPIDYTKQESIKQEAIKQEVVELTVTDSASGTTTIVTIASSTVMWFTFISLMRSFRQRGGIVAYISNYI